MIVMYGHITMYYNCMISGSKSAGSSGASLVAAAAAVKRETPSSCISLLAKKSKPGAKADQTKIPKYEEIAAECKRN